MHMLATLSGELNVETEEEEVMLGEAKVYQA